MWGWDSNGYFLFWDTENMLTDGAIGDLAGVGGFYESAQSINPSSSTPALPDYYRGYCGNEFAWHVEDQWKDTAKRPATTAQAPPATAVRMVG